MDSRPRRTRKQIEEELRKSEEKFSKAFRLSPTALILTSAKESRYIEVNESFERMTGWRRDEVVGRTSYDVGLWVDPGQRAAPIQRLLLGETIRNVELNIRTKTGDVRTILGSAELIDINGEPCVLASAVDTTDLKCAEAARRDSEERFRLAMNNVASGVYTLDLNGLVTFVNPAAEAMFGWTNADLLGRKMHDVTHHKHPDGSPFPASDCPGLQVLQEGVELHEQEDTFIRKDGRLFPVVYSSSPLKTEGKTVGLVVGFRDDTLCREAERAVRESEERFRLIANTAPVMIWITDVDGLVTYVNQSYLDFTGLTLGAALGDGWMTVPHPDEVKRLRDVYVKASSQRQPFQEEQRLRRHDGEYRWVLSTGVPRFNVDGSFVGYIGTAIDITERKLAADALATVRQKLIEAHEEERSRFARELHDNVSQRLASLSLHLQRVKHSPPASAAELAEEIGVAIQQTTDLATDIQALSHRLHSSKLEFLGLAAAAAGFCEELSDRQRVDIDFHSENISETLPPAISLSLFRVLQEALQNAIKHSGSRRFQVLLRGRVDDVELTVQDSGVGFDLQQAMRGRGLGLTSMQERLGLVGGQVSIHSELGRGTTIQARVPLSSPTQSACV